MSYGILPEELRMGTVYLYRLLPRQKAVERIEPFEFSINGNENTYRLAITLNDL